MITTSRSRQKRENQQRNCDGFREKNTADWRICVDCEKLWEYWHRFLMGGSKDENDERWGWSKQPGKLFMGHSSQKFQLESRYVYAGWPPIWKIGHMQSSEKNMMHMKQLVNLCTGKFGWRKNRKVSLTKFQFAKQDIIDDRSNLEFDSTT